MLLSGCLQFTLDVASNFRAYVEEHRVDIDIRLYNRSGEYLDSALRDAPTFFLLILETIGILDRSITFGQEESVIITLAPGSYNFTITYYGASDPQFCETFFLMIGIAPLALVPPEMCTANPSLPSVRRLKQFIPSEPTSSFGICFF